MVGMNILSSNLMTNKKIVETIDHVKEQLSENYSNFELVTDNEQDYYQMSLISEVYANDMKIIQIIIHIKPITQRPLLLYKIKIIPVPVKQIVSGCCMATCILWQMPLDENSIIMPPSWGTDWGAVA